MLKLCNISVSILINLCFVTPNETFLNQTIAMIYVDYQKSTLLCKELK